jgi:hypothetical protein
MASSDAAQSCIDALFGCNTDAPKTRCGCGALGRRSFYNSTFLNRSAFVITDTELKVIAALAIIGLSKMPRKGYNTPAAIGTPTQL